ncbi:putative Lipoprotein [Pseudomonas amygdali pv. ulmi]|uniref:Putative Lipoprotein n=1 Tax=Pseudomonas amygdali pv. ulmi TaxID=251720 RepID=A0A0Q0D689_PSEA0|nr:putative Lipoprotein [Pseudomonas amygdali pv. ulmi]
MPNRLLILITALTLATLAGCAGPLPTVNPDMAWVEMRTVTGQLIMGDKLDGENTYDGRYFQVTPGQP